ncbi:MAG: signal peptidase II [Anaerolineae bacterium]|nr:signal peptidase II [Anaerolineae bacterium]
MTEQEQETNVPEPANETWFQELPLSETDDSIESEEEVHSSSPIFPDAAELPPIQPAPLGQKIIPLLLAAIILGSDQVSKHLIIINLDVYESYAPIPALANFFQFTHIHNTGAALGMFPSGGLFFTIIAIIVAIAIVIYNRRLGEGHYLLRIALGMQLGGALGNLTDRLRLGYVTDFMDVIPLPAIFNLADAAIVGGVVVLFYLMLLETLEERRHKQAQAREMEMNGEVEADPSDNRRLTGSTRSSLTDSETI